ncbi:DNA-directed DNA polymerase gamma mip1 [Microbotryomycetes sp. JL201]|nr:DNA-directed DNA polymerase gamma mip1 [Microbotryomycetes sp. JL201]
MTTRTTCRPVVHTPNATVCIRWLLGAGCRRLQQAPEEDGGAMLAYSATRSAAQQSQDIQHRKAISVRLYSTSAHSPATHGQTHQYSSLDGAPPPLNEAQVPLIAPNLRAQLFPPPASKYSPTAPDPQAIAISLQHLRSHGLASPDATSKQAQEPAIDFQLPQLQGPTLSHHFHALGMYSAEPYLSLAREFAEMELPPMPDKDRWMCMSGWTKYSPDGCWESVSGLSPDSQAIVFDVETLPYQGGNFPILAVAVAKDGWYAWSSPWLTGEDASPNHLIPFPTRASPNSPSSDLFEIPEDPARLIIGHNVLYDRARMASEYKIRRPATRFLDTLSLHVAVSGLTNPQRPAWLQYRKKLRESEENGEHDSGSAQTPANIQSKPVPVAPKTWREVGAVNSLAEVARLHCGTKMDKTARDILIDPHTTIEDIRADFESIADYCARDVQTTLDVFRAVLPKFLSTCPHPASFAGILLMSQPILPVDEHWPRYLERAEQTYQSRSQEVKEALKMLAEEARGKFEKIDEQGRFAWEDDVWLRQLDWSPKRARRISSSNANEQGSNRTSQSDVADQSENQQTSPRWLQNIISEDGFRVDVESPTMALLLRTKWRGHPVVYSQKLGWLFAVDKGDHSFEPAAKEKIVKHDSLGPKDSLLQEMQGLKLFTVPATGSGRCLKLFGRASAKRVTDGLLSSDVDNEVLNLVIEDPSSAELQQAIEDAILYASQCEPAQRQNDVWLRQLDWTPVATSLARKTSSRTPNDSTASSTVVKGEALAWPRWYWDLDIPGGGLDVSVRKRAVPLLLRLRWRGFPIAYSKQHGWMYRVPTKDVQVLLDSDNTLKPVEFKDVADSDLLDDTYEATYFKLPHPDGEGKNVGNPLSKPFLSAFEDGILTSEYPAAKDALALNASCSYWVSSRERIMNQMVVWEGDAKKPAPTGGSENVQGLILPQVIPMGTITRRAVEKTWLTASNAKKNRVGSELKSMVRAPPGFAIVGADVDSEELWICSVMGDAQFGMHGATAIGWMTLEGTKSAGTDLHSKSASILGISRDAAKVFNYSRIYGAGIKHAVQLLLKFNPTLSMDQAQSLAKELYAATKGLVNRSPAFGRRKFWHGGTESFVFNKLEEIAQSDRPRTPTLGCGLTAALTKSYLPAEGKSGEGEGFMPSRINWVVQSSGVDYLHMLLVSMEYLTRRFDIDARYMISVHDEIRYLVKEEDKYRAAMALQVANLWTRAMFAYRLQMPDLPQGCAFFSAVDVDHCFRKEVNMTCQTPSNPDAIEFGESIDIKDALNLTSGGSLFKDGRAMSAERDLHSLPTPARELTEYEVRGDAHRVDKTAFLVAQTLSSTEEIKRLWERESNGRNFGGDKAKSVLGVRTSSTQTTAPFDGYELHADMLEAASKPVKPFRSSRPHRAPKQVEQDGFDEGEDVPEEFEESMSAHTPLHRTHV